MVFDAEFLHQAGWFLINSFLAGLVALPVLWMVRALSLRCPQPTRSPTALLMLLLVTVGPLVVGWRLMPERFTPEIGTEGPAAHRSPVAPAAVPFQDFAPIFQADRDPVETSRTPEKTLSAGVSEAFAGASHSSGLGPEQPSDAEQSPSGVVAVLPLVWLAGFVGTGLVLLLGLVGSAKLRSHTEALPRALQRVADEIFARADRSPIAVRLSVRVTTPILLGIFQPLILLPVTAVGWTPETLQFVILHELAHARRRDNLVNLMQRLFEAVCFFQPVVWLASAWVRTEREICCDDFVVRTTRKPVAYAETLVRLATGSGRSIHTTDLVTCSSTRHALVGRVARLMGKDETMRLRMRTVVLALSAVLGTAAVGLAGFLVPAPAPQDAAADDPGETITSAKHGDSTRQDRRQLNDVPRSADEASKQTANVDSVKLVAGEETEIKMRAHSSQLVSIGSELRSIQDYNTRILRVETLTADRARIHALRPGQIVLTLTGSDDRSYQARISVGSAGTSLETDIVSLDPFDEIHVRAQTDGTVRRVNVNVGDTVTHRQTLATLRNEQVKAEFEALSVDRSADIKRRLAEKALEIAERRLKVATEKEERARLQLEVEIKQLEVESARQETLARELRRKQIMTRLEGASLAAPIAGRVSQVSARVGAPVQTGESLFVITNSTQLRASFFVPLEQTPNLKSGQAVRFLPRNNASLPLDGRISVIDSKVNRITQHVRVTATLDNSDQRIRAGQIGRIVVLGERDSSSGERVPSNSTTGETVTVKQRRAKLILDGKALVSLSDITASQVLITVRGRESNRSRFHSRTLIDERPVRLGDVVSFEYAGRSYSIRVHQLTNVLIGDDYAVLEIVEKRRRRPSPVKDGTVPENGLSFMIKKSDVTRARQVLRLIFQNDENPPTITVKEKSGELKCQGSAKQLTLIRSVLLQLGYGPRSARSSGQTDRDPPPRG